MKIHMVKKGDTLYLIAQKYNVPLEELIKANPEIPNPDEIDVGMKVKIPAPAKPTYELMHQHTVQQGDSLWKLSKAWGIPLSDMILANPQLKNPNVLLTGEVVNIPKLPPVASPAADPDMQGWIPGKKNTGVKPETGVAMEPAPMPAPLPELPAMPVPEVPAMPAPLPMPEAKHPYPAKYPYDHDLFAQMPVPAAEAGAYGKMEQGPVPMPAAGEAMAAEPAYMHDYGYHDGHPYGYGHDYGHDHAYGHGYGYGGLEGAVGSVYDPKDISGYGVKPDGYGDISQAGTAKAPSTGVTGYLPAYVPGLVSPAAGTMKPPSGCHNCGGTPSWQTAPAATAWPANPAAPAWPNVPAIPTPYAPAMPTEVSPAMAAPMMAPMTAPMMAPMTAPMMAPMAAPMMAPMTAPMMAPMTAPITGPMMGPSQSPYPGAVLPATAVSPEAGVYPGMGWPEAEAVPGAYPSGTAYPYGTMPYGYDAYAHPYEHYAAYPAAAPLGGLPAETAPAAVVPVYPETVYHAYPETVYHAYPEAAYHAMPAYPMYGVSDGYYCDPAFDHYGVPYPAAVPGIPPLPPLRENNDARNEANSLSLHAAEDNADPISAVIPKKRQSPTKPKASPARRFKQKRKESLPWIKW